MPALGKDFPHVPSLYYLSMLLHHFPYPYHTQENQPQCIKDWANLQGNLLAITLWPQYTPCWGQGIEVAEGAGGISYVLYWCSEISKHLEGLCSFSANWIQATGLTADLCPVSALHWGSSPHLDRSWGRGWYNAKVLGRWTLPTMGTWVTTVWCHTHKPNYSVNVMSSLWLNVTGNFLQGWEDLSKKPS